jgi:hypothetical protein
MRPSSSQTFEPVQAGAPLVTDGLTVARGKELGQQQRGARSTFDGVGIGRQVCAGVDDRRDQGIGEGAEHDSSQSRADDRADNLVGLVVDRQEDGWCRVVQDAADPVLGVRQQYRVEDRIPLQ